MSQPKDWSRVEVVFNSLDQTEVNLNAGVWGGKEGTLWLDDLAIEEMSLVNILRREVSPLSVSSKDGKTPYTEGRDFVPVRDAKLGMVPYDTRANTTSGIQSRRYGSPRPRESRTAKGCW